MAASITVFVKFSKSILLFSDKKAKKGNFSGIPVYPYNSVQFYWGFSKDVNILEENNNKDSLI